MSIPLAIPCLSGNTLRYLEECIRTNFVSSVGPFVDRFEREFAAATGAPYAVACVNGTAALHMAMRLLEVGPGDDVFVSTLTFVASVNPILYQGATPVLVDAERQTWNMDPALVVEEIERRARLGIKLPKAVEVVHILGHPADISPILEVCRKYDIPVVEDAAESLGATYETGSVAGRTVGTVGTLGCFSFNGNKIITTGGGGMITTHDPGLAQRAKHLSTQAKVGGPELYHDDIGYNYRLTNLAAALGVAQLEQLPEFMRRKRAIARRYDDAVREFAGVTRPPRAPWANPIFWLYSVLIDRERFGIDRFETRALLESVGVESRSLWPPLHLMPIYRHLPRLGGGVAESLFTQGISLPCSVGLTPGDQEVVIDALRRVAAGTLRKAGSG